MACQLFDHRDSYSFRPIYSLPAEGHWSDVNAFNGCNVEAWSVILQHGPSLYKPVIDNLITPRPDCVTHTVYGRDLLLPAAKMVQSAHNVFLDLDLPMLTENALRNTPGLMGYLQHEQRSSMAAPVRLVAQNFLSHRHSMGAPFTPYVRTTQATQGIMPFSRFKSPSPRRELHAPVSSYAIQPAFTGLSHKEARSCVLRMYNPHVAYPPEIEVGRRVDDNGASSTDIQYELYSNCFFTRPNYPGHGNEFFLPHASGLHGAMWSSAVTTTYLTHAFVQAQGLEAPSYRKYTSGSPRRDVTLITGQVVQAIGYYPTLALHFCDGNADNVLYAAPFYNVPVVELTAGPHSPCVEGFPPLVEDCLMCFGNDFLDRFCWSEKPYILWFPLRSPLSLPLGLSTLQVCPPDRPGMTLMIPTGDTITHPLPTGHPTLLHTALQAYKRHAGTIVACTGLPYREQSLSVLSEILLWERNAWEEQYFNWPDPSSITARKRILTSAFKHIPNIGDLFNDARAHQLPIDRPITTDTALDDAWYGRERCKVEGNTLSPFFYPPITYRPRADQTAFLGRALRDSERAARKELFDQLKRPPYTRIRVYDTGRMHVGWSVQGGAPVVLPYRLPERRYADNRDVGHWWWSRCSGLQRCTPDVFHGHPIQNIDEDPENGFQYRPPGRKRKPWIV